MLPARAISAFGDDLALLVLMLRVYSAGRGPWSITMLLLCATIPVVVLAPVAGRLVDSHPVPPLAIAAGLWQAACCVGLAFADPLWASTPSSSLLQCGQVVANPAWQCAGAVDRRAGRGRARGGRVPVADTLAAVAAPAAAGVLVGTCRLRRPVADRRRHLRRRSLRRRLAIRTTRGRAARRDEPARGSRPASRSGRRAASPADRSASARSSSSARSTNVVEVFLLRGTLGAGTLVFGLVGAALAVGVVVGSLLAGRNVPDGRPGAAHGPRRARPRR